MKKPPIISLVSAKGAVDHARLAVLALHARAAWSDAGERLHRATNWPRSRKRLPKARIAA